MAERIAGHIAEVVEAAQKTRLQTFKKSGGLIEKLVHRRTGDIYIAPEDDGSGMISTELEVNGAGMRTDVHFNRKGMITSVSNFRYLSYAEVTRVEVYPIYPRSTRNFGSYFERGDANLLTKWEKKFGRLIPNSIKNGNPGWEKNVRRRRQQSKTTNAKTSVRQ